MLSPKKYIQAIELTQVVSIDLIIYNKDGKVLLGKRKNRPAQNSYFVPGGRIYKNESLKQGLQRLVKDELGLNNLNYTFYCVSDHIYDDNFLNRENISTHYVCIAVKLYADNVDLKVFEKQHSDCVWLTPNDILSREDVHKYTKYYFQQEAPNRL